jgi:hypothetical protein
MFSLHTDLTAVMKLLMSRAVQHTMDDEVAAIETVKRLLESLTHSTDRGLGASRRRERSALHTLTRKRFDARRHTRHVTVCRPTNLSRSPEPDRSAEGSTDVSCCERRGSSGWGTGILTESLAW